MAVKYARLFDAVTQFQLKGGQLNVAGRLFVHFSDTDDLADVYDENGTQLNQPVILDNNGRAAGLFVDSAKVYWLDVQDQFGMSQFTIRKMTPCGGGGGSQLGNTYDVVSSDGSVAVDKFTEGNNTTFDLTLPDEIARKEWVEDNFQPTLTAGANITIVDNVISATGGGGGGALPPSTPADEGKVLTVDEDGLPEWRSLGEDSSYAIANGSIAFTPGSYYTDGRVTLSNIRSNGIEYAYNHDGWVLEKDHVYVITFNIILSIGYPESGTLIGGRVWLDGFQESDQVWKFALDTSLSHDESLVGSAIVCLQNTGEVHLNVRYDSPALAHIPSASVNKAEIVDVTAMVSGGGLQPVQSNWAESDSQSLAFIQNKPFVSKVVYSDWQGDFGYDVNIPTLTIDSESHKVSGAGYDLGVMPPYPTTTESGNRALMLSSQSRVPSWQSVYSKSETDTLLGAKQPTLTAGTNVSIDANNVISATDTTYTAGAYINISNANVIENTMHLDTSGLLVAYNTLGNSGTTNHSFGPWRIQIEKSAMATWDSSSGDASVHIKFGHADYLEGGITAGSILQDTYNPWYGWTFASAQFSHTRWGFDGSMASGPTGGFPIHLTSPMDSDNVARTCPRSMQGHKYRINAGIAAPDWLELTVEPVYINNNTSLTSNAVRLLIQVKYFYS